MSKDTKFPIRVNTKTNLLCYLRWTGKKWVDKAGHKWELKDIWESQHHGHEVLGR